MTIYVLRHGIAEPRRPRVADEKRALTREGEEKLRQVLGVARAAKVAPTLVVSSPLKRALQTAEIARKVLGCKKAVVRTDALAPAGTPEAVWEEIRTRHPVEQAVLLAGHEPLLGQTIGFLLGAPAAVVDLKKGALARIEIEEAGPKPHGLLAWLLTPRLAAACEA